MVRAITLLFALLAILFLFIGLTYNKLIRARNQMREGWSGIEVQLKRRHNLVPNLVECVKGVAQFEQETLTALTEARAKAASATTAAEAEKSEQALVDQMGSLFAVTENYPELKSTEAFRQLMADLTEIEDHLQYARRYYNGAVRILNNAVETFPSNLIANSFGFETAPFFEVAEVSERLAPSLKDLSA